MHDKEWANRQTEQRLIWYATFSSKFKRHNCSPEKEVYTNIFLMKIFNSKKQGLGYYYQIIKKACFATGLHSVYIIYLWNYWNEDVYKLLKHMDCRTYLQSVLESRVLDSGFRILGPGFWILGPGFWVQGSGLWVSGPGFRIMGPGSNQIKIKLPCYLLRTYCWHVNWSVISGWSGYWLRAMCTLHVYSLYINTLWCTYMCGLSKI